MEMSKQDTQDLWTPFKKLQQIVEFTLTSPLDTATIALGENLSKYKQNFLTLLKNVPKSPTARDELQKGLSAGITVPGIGHQMLSRDLYEETLILSDMFDLNEFMALDLLCIAQMQICNYPGLTRGLVAVLLYYDSRNTITSILRTLVQARSGVLWTAQASSDVIRLITKFTDHLYHNGLFTRIFELLSVLDISKEIDMLQKNYALGNAKHQRQIFDQFQQIRQNLADVVYLWSAQGGLTKEVTVQLIDFQKNTKIEGNASGGIDNITLTLQMALLYAVDLNILQRFEEGDELIRKLPLIDDKTFVDYLTDEFSTENSQWNYLGLQTLTYFAWGLSLATLRLSTFAGQYSNSIERSELLIDFAIQSQVLDFMHRILLNNETIYKEEYYIRRLHILVTDFIILMHSKVKELRLRADETARTIQIYNNEGLEAPSNLPHYYEHLLLTVARLYRDDPLALNLVLEFWTNFEGSQLSRVASRSVTLFKFVRQAGEMLPPTLFVSYLSMLRSLSINSQAARYTFNLLKQNSSTNVTTVSWDHFFNSLNQYYANLKQEGGVPQSDTIYTMRHVTHIRGITPMEQKGLHSVLMLIKTVAENDEFARIAFCEHPAWSPLLLMLGLVSCSIPTSLKADLLNALAAFTKSPDIASQVWTNLEAAQILVTIPSTSSYQSRGIETELNEIESRMEDYELTRAFLHLLNTLTNAGIPRTLGAGPRKPGFDPYFNYIMNTVFLKFHTRSYKNQEEKWQVAKLCLDLFLKFLILYDPQVDDVDPQKDDISHPPGYHLMVLLNTKSEFIDLILNVLHESITMFDSWTSFVGKKDLEDATLLCLKILNEAFQLQQKFYAFIMNSSVTIIIMKLSDLLLGINKRTNQADHMLNIAKFVSFNQQLPRHTMYAIKILHHIVQRPGANTQLLGLFSTSDNSGLPIIQGFVECLENNVDDGDSNTTLTKATALKFLKYCLAHPAPNLAHFFFGFNYKGNVKSTVIQNPGILNQPKTCLHAVFNALNRSAKFKNSPFASDEETVIESMYHTLYLLCANPYTFEPVLRYVRSKHDFFANHLTTLPLNTKCNASTTNQIAWILKICAIEIKISSENKHLSQLTNLTHLLVGHAKKLTDLRDTTTKVDEESASDLAVNRLVALLNNIDFKIETLSMPDWDFFDNNSVKKIFLDCEHTISGVKLINIKRLHTILTDELTCQANNNAQKPLIIREVERILSFAVKNNSIKSNMGATVRFMNAWKECSDMIFLSVPTEVLSLQDRQNIIVHMLHSLLFISSANQFSLELSKITTENIYVLFVCLKKAFVSEQKRNMVMNVGQAATVTSATLLSNTLTLQHILKKVIEWIILSPVTAQRTRINLYSSVLTLMSIVNQQNEDRSQIYSGATASPQNYIRLLDGTQSRKLTSTAEDLIVMPFNELMCLSERLFDVVCHDYTGGHDVNKMLALAIINAMIEVDPNVSWINFLSLRGYLKHIVDSVLDDDDKLVRILDLIPEDIRNLLLYESKMGVLCRIATTRTGAECLLQHKVLAALSTMRVFSYHPDNNTMSVRQLSSKQSSEFTSAALPSIEERYQRILFPVFHLSEALLTSLGAENQSVCLEIIGFFLAHSDMVESLLRVGSPTNKCQSLNELAMLTGLIARCTNYELKNIERFSEHASYFTRLERLMLALLPRFILTSQLTRSNTNASKVMHLIDETSMFEDQDVSSECEKTLQLQRCLDVNCNLMLYVRNLLAINERTTTVVFAPSPYDMEMGASDVLNVSTFHSKLSHTSLPLKEQSTPSLGVIIKQLIQSVEFESREKLNVDVVKQKLSKVTSMNATELRDYVVISNDKFNIAQCRAKAFKKLRDDLADRQKTLASCQYLIESCMYLLWVHLNYYMKQAVPRADISNYSISGNGNETSADLSWKLSIEDISVLKQNLITTFSEKFCKELVATTEGNDQVSKHFVEKLLRGIKHLIQFVPVK